MNTNKYIALLCAVCLTIPNTLYSHSGATGIVKERMDSMKEMSDASKSIAKMFKGEAEFNREMISDTAALFILHGSKMAELYPDTPDSRTGSKTEALPKIWEDWGKFNTMIDEFIENSEALQTTVKSTDDAKLIRKAFYKTAKDCKACHKRFRKPKS